LALFARGVLLGAPKHHPRPHFAPSPDSNPVDLIPLFNLDDDAFRRRFRDTPLWRAKRRGILRNAAIILGNQKCREAMPALTRGLTDAEPLIREACQWALNQIKRPELFESTPSPG
jgi:epoxyqueuosine reductase